MARGHVSDTFLPGEFDMDPEVSTISDEHARAPPSASSEDVPLGSPPRFGRIHQVVAAQPATQALREEVTYVLENAYQVGAAAAAMLPSSGANLTVGAEARLESLERLFSNLTGANGTIDHIFTTVNMLQAQVQDIREDIDCKTSQGKAGRQKYTRCHADDGAISVW